MKVIVLGFPRTGTQSIAGALEQLGCNKVYHMREVGKNNHQDKWTEGLDAKFRNVGKRLTREDFDHLFGGFDATADFPASIFAEELIAAYPDAKLILSVRDEDLWFKSMEKTLIHSYDTSSTVPTPMRKLAEKYHQLIWKDDFAINGREAYGKHNVNVFRVAADAKREILLYDVKEGWEPLCTLLNKDVPEEAFPRVDAWTKYKEMHATE